MYSNIGLLAKFSPDDLEKEKSLSPNRFAAIEKSFMYIFIRVSCLMSDMTCLKYIIISSIAEREIE